MKLPVREFDAVVIGAGGTDMRTALQISQNGQTYALLSKVFPTRSHTVPAQGGIIVALGNTHEDNWEWHMCDTVKGSDYIGDRDATEYMYKAGPETILELDHMGLPFSRLDNGTTYQHPFGDQSKNFGGEQAAHTAAATDRIGHALLHALYRQNLRNHTTIFSERYTLDLVRNADDAVVGCTALHIGTSEVIYFKARATVLTIGGTGRIYQSTTNAHISTGDGVGMVIRAGVPVQGVEMWQFHPAGITGTGILVTGGCRGKGGYLLNRHGERFTERYVPNVKDLAGRDMVARSIMIEIHRGRGCDDPWGPYTKLKLDHLGKEVLESRLPGILELSRTFAHVSPIKGLILVIPTCHYTIGGIPTKVVGRALTVNEQSENVVIPGLFAVDEIACVSVHDASRLGSNSLLDLIVFDHTVGLHLQELIAEQGDLLNTTEDEIGASLARLNRWNGNRSGEDPMAIRKTLQECMQHDFSVFREGDAMTKSLEELKAIRGRLKNTRLDDTSSEFNTQCVECLELDNLMETAYATAVSINFRIEGRGTHSHFDFPERDDGDWLCRSLCLPESESMT